MGDHEMPQQTTFPDAEELVAVFGARVARPATPADAEPPRYAGPQETTEARLARSREWCERIARERKFVDDDMTLEIREFALYYLHDYEEEVGTEQRRPFEFLTDMCRSLKQYGHLTPAQSRGVLNCFRADLLRSDRSAAEAEAAERGRRDMEETAAYLAYREHLARLVWNQPGMPGDMFDAELEMRVAEMHAERGEVAQEPLDGTFTLVRPDGTHVTLRLQRPGANSRGNYPEGARIASMLVGPENTRDFAGFAVVVGRRVERNWRTARSFSSGAYFNPVPPEWIRHLNALLGMESGALNDAGYQYALRSGNCYRCGRELTVPASISRGIGPRCAALV